MRLASWARAGGWIAIALALLPLAAEAQSDKARQIERGRYLVKLGGCNDCHTSGYAPSGGKVPEKLWLMGDGLGYRGDWGTTYPSNLRLVMQKLTADQWVQLAHSIETRPPMPWFVLHEITATDLRAMHAFIRSLGPPGDPAPAALPPGQEPKGPVVVFPAAPPR